MRATTCVRGHISRNHEKSVRSSVSERRDCVIGIMIGILRACVESGPPTTTCAAADGAPARERHARRGHTVDWKCSIGFDPQSDDQCESR